MFYVVIFPIFLNYDYINKYLITLLDIRLIVFILLIFNFQLYNYILCSLSFWVVADAEIYSEASCPIHHHHLFSHSYATAQGLAAHNTDWQPMAWTGDDRTVDLSLTWTGGSIDLDHLEVKAVNGQWHISMGSGSSSANTTDVKK